METLEKFHEIARDPFSFARAAKAAGGMNIMGYVCSYAPIEIISAAGFLPFRIFGQGKNSEKADAHLQSYCCGHVRNALSDAISGELDFLDGTIFPHTCDSIQRLSDLWRMNTDFGFHYDLVVPVKVSGENAEKYMTAVLRRFRNELESAFQIEISDDKIRAAADKYNRIRSGLKRLYALRLESPGAISGSDMHAALRAFMSMDPDRFLDMLEALMKHLEASGPLAGERDGQDGATPKRLMISGGICDSPDFYSFIEEAGGVVVQDDLCSGSRSFSEQIDLNGDIIESIGKSYLKRIVCPSKHDDLYARGNRLLESAKKAKADGVVFIFLKFCDPHLFDYPWLRNLLKENGIDSIMFEMEDKFLPDGPFKTRMEAFLEMARNR